MAESSNNSNNETELTMCDVLEEEQELEDDANAVLGGSDDTNCSYEKGYVSRQALYACTTCSSDNQPSGVCLACSYKCHDGHEIVELYTKRYFRCDCGNSKFGGRACTLKPDKEPLNDLNKYNQNFHGLYCSCSRPYPDLEDDTPDEMIQCVICEDWYHGRHIGGAVPDDYVEMICAKCMESHKFLYPYLNKFHYVNVNDASAEVKEECNGAVKPPVPEDEKPPIKTECEEAVDKCTLVSNSNQADAVVEDNACSIQIKAEVKTEMNGSDTQDNPDCFPNKFVQPPIKTEREEAVDKCTPVNNSNQADAVVEGNACSVESKAEVKTEMNGSDSQDCFLNKFVIKPDGITSGPAFWPENWRKELCKCSSCMEMYARLQCGYLVNPEDTILAYEERGKSTTESQYDRGLSALSQLDRVKQMEAIRAYTSMKGQLKEYLKEFANNKRTVCESDIKEFFERISKRQKMSNGVPHFCR